MTDVFRLTADFAEQCLGLNAPDEPTRLSVERKTWATRAMLEELDEFRVAQTMTDEVDALCDLIYFAAGRLHEMGVLGGAHFEEVHGCNLDKKRGRLEKRSHGLSEEGGFDAVKPEGWNGPDHSSLIHLKAGTSPFMAFKTRMGTEYLRDPRTEADGRYTHVIDSMRPPRALLSKPRKPKVLVLGHARHGKDTVAEMLRDRHGYRFASSSMFCCEKVMMPYFNSLQGCAGYATAEDCYEDRVNHRATWYDQISLYNSEDPSRLAREMLAENDLYVGMRSAKEFKAARHLFDHVVWVCSGARGLPPEPKDSFDIRLDMGMDLIRNDGTLEDLARAVDNYALRLENSR